ncbi:MAG: nickel pincer cofactor biosynthesis protein LarC [Methanolinea sp.]
MRVLVFEPFRGAAGDMVCGALLQLGADRTMVSRAMASVVAEPGIREVDRAGIRAIKVDTRAPVVNRSLAEVISCVKGSDSPPDAIAMACRVFERMARGEARVHGEHSHFHEVGADDAIAEVIGACTALLSLSVDAVVVEPLAMGGGTVVSVHGTYPVPTPATLAIVQESGLNVHPGTREDGELCTPTGAALLAECASAFPGSAAKGRIVAVGYGAGDRDSPTIPNVLRATLLEAGDTAGDHEVDILETNLDDVTGEVLATCIEKLMTSGARDVCAIPCTMKKGRPGFLIRVVCLPEDTPRLSRELALETGTLGVRCLPYVHRFIAEREIRTVTLTLCGKPWDIPVKCGFIEGDIFSIKAESARVQEVAGHCALAAREVARLAEEEAWKTFGRKNS